ncbi:MAG TPA: DUF4434 domain-containing protein [Kofleriaceae bacterium]
MPLMCVDGQLVQGPAKFDASFVQIRHEQRSFDVARWRQELSVLHDLGVKLIILQFSGDEHGSYDGPTRTPVAALLAAAHLLDMHVLVGLHDDPTWPSDAAARRLAPPLDDAIAATTLGATCANSPACAGWYIPQEIDDASWSSDARVGQLRDHISRTARALRTLTPGTEATTFQGDLEWDSLTVMDFVAAIEDEFDIIITMNMQAEIENVGQLIDAVEKLKA